MPGRAAPPRKTREIHNHHIDSTVWNEFRFRDGDIVIASYAKSGTTWLQQIIAQLLFDGAEAVEVADISPWMDLRIPPKDIKLARVEAQTHRRFVKTHLPTDALRYSTRAKYIYIGRDGRDIIWSMYHHHCQANEAWYAGLNKTPGLVGPPIEKPPDSVKQYYHDWLDRDGYPFWPFWENVRSWWEIRDLPNLKLLHFNHLKRDLPGAVREIAGFLEIPVAVDSWARILAHCSFDYMKANADKTVPFNGALWRGGAQTFIHKGTNGRWRDLLDADEIAKYDRYAAAELSPECAHWLATGETDDTTRRVK